MFYTNDLCWIDDPAQLKGMLKDIVAVYKPLAPKALRAPETLKYYISAAGEDVLTCGNVPSGTEGGGQESAQGAGINGLELEFIPTGFKFPLTFIYTYEGMARACMESHHLLFEGGMDKKELLACMIPPYQTNFSLEIIREIHNDCSGGKYRRRSDMTHFIAIFPNDCFYRESVLIPTRSGDVGFCKFFSMEIREPLPYDILAIGKTLLV